MGNCINCGKVINNKYKFCSNSCKDDYYEAKKTHAQRMSELD